MAENLDRDTHKGIFLFPTFGNGNETLLFPGMIGNGNGNALKKLGQILYFVVKIRDVFYIRFLVKLTIKIEL